VFVNPGAARDAADDAGAKLAEIEERLMSNVTQAIAAIERKSR